MKHLTDILKESLLDDEETMSGTFNRVGNDIILTELAENIAQNTHNKFRSLSKGLKLDIEDNVLKISCVGSLVAINNETLNELNKYKEILGFDELYADCEMQFIAVKDLQHTFKKISLPKITFLSMPSTGLKDIHIHFIEDKSIMKSNFIFKSEFCFGMRLDGVKITIDDWADYSKPIVFDSVPFFKNCDMQSVRVIKIKNEVLFKIPSVLANINQLLDAKYKMEIDTYGSSPVIKACQARNLRSVANGMGTKYKTFTEGKSYISFKSNASIDLVIDGLSSFKNLEEICFTDDKVDFDFINSSKKPRMTTGRSSGGNTDPLVKQLPNSDWFLIIR